MNKETKVFIKYILSQQKEISKLKSTVKELIVIIENMDSDIEYISKVLKNKI